MRHRIDKKFFNRDTKARKAMFNALTISLFEHGVIVTSRPKANVAARQAEKLITIAKRGDVMARRRLHRVFGRRDVVNNLCDRVAPVLSTHNSGFTTLEALGNRRGDNTPLFKLSLVAVLPEKKQKTEQQKNNKHENA